MQIKFTIPIQPKGWKRPGKRRDGRRYNASEKDQEALILYAKAAGVAQLFTEHGLYRVTIKTFKPRPKQRPHYIPPKVWKTGRALFAPVTPDFDNFAKNLCDALNGIAYRDDAQIVDARIMKFYAGVGEQARWEIEIEQFE